MPIRRDGARSVGVLDAGRYAAALAAGRPDPRPVFDRLSPAGVVWSDGTEEPVDAASSPPARGPTSATSPASAPSTRTGGRSTAAAAASPSPASAMSGCPARSATVRGVGGDARRIAGWLRRVLSRRFAADLPVPAACRVLALDDR